MVVHVGLCANQRFLQVTTGRIGTVHWHQSTMLVIQSCKRGFDDNSHSKKGPVDHGSPTSFIGGQCFRVWSHFILGELSSIFEIK